VQPVAPTPERDHLVDLLRGLSILVVMIGHFAIAYHADEIIPSGIAKPLLMKLLVRNEHYAVISFFAISGFLITSRTRRRYRRLGNIDAAEFYLFRSARIMPCLLLFLAIVAFFDALGVKRFGLGSPSVSPALSVASVLLSFHNVLMAKAGWFSYCLNILWSISVEEAFYVTFPLLCLIARDTRLIGLVWTVVIVLGPIHRALWPTEMVQGYGYLSCFDAIGFGCCAAILHLRLPASPRLAVLLQVAGAGLVTIASLARPEMGLVAGDTVVACGTAMLLLTAGRRKREPRPISRPLRSFGQQSYELYLFHIVVLALMLAMTDRVAPPASAIAALFVVYLCASAACADLVSRFYSDVLNRRIRESFRRHDARAGAA
jgi:peptidoglycan/LPS O-acetylase OafA/YrhL